MLEENSRIEETSPVESGETLIQKGGGKNPASGMISYLSMFESVTQDEIELE